MLETLKTLWIHLFLPVVIGLGLVAILAVSSFFSFVVYVPKCYVPMGFMGIFGACGVGGFLVMSFTGLPGLWYKPLLSSLVIHLYLYGLMFVPCTLKNFDRAESLAINLLPCYAVSYVMGMIGVSFWKSQQKQQGQPNQQCHAPLMGKQEN